MHWSKKKEKLFGGENLSINLYYMVARVLPHNRMLCLLSRLFVFCFIEEERSVKSTLKSQLKDIDIVSVHIPQNEWQETRKIVQISYESDTLGSAYVWK